jgi:hypothetical protein
MARPGAQSAGGEQVLFEHGIELSRELRGWKELGGWAVPKFFFDLVDDKTIYDKKGVSLPNVKEARRYAITFARELMETRPKLLGESWHKWSVQICNGKFDRIMKVPVVDVFEGES